MVAGGLVGCAAGSSATPSLTPTTTAVDVTGGQGGGIMFAVSVRFSGATAAAGSFSDRTLAESPLDCPTWAAKGADGLLSVPAPAPSGASINGVTVSYAALLRGYHGPGTYDSGVILPALSVGDSIYIANSAASHLALVTRPDGSGSLTISAYQDAQNSLQLESGTIAWTCGGR